MKCAIIQPSFLPWRGTFDLIHSVDTYIVLDDVQYDKRGWRNRNLIKTANGLKWISVPVSTKGRYNQTIKDTRIDNTIHWQKKIIGSIRNNYSKANYIYLFDSIEKILMKQYSFLLDLNVELLGEIMSLVNIQTRIEFSSELDIRSTEKNGRLVEICKKIGAAHYVSGPTAKTYLGDGRKFKESGISLNFQDYNYPPYKQLFGAFEPQVSIIDLIFNIGLEKIENYIWDVKKA